MRRIPVGSLSIVLLVVCVSLACGCSVTDEVPGELADDTSRSEPTTTASGQDTAETSGETGGEDTPAYEVISEDRQSQTGSTVVTVNIETDVVAEPEMRLIAEEVKADNDGAYIVNVNFYRAQQAGGGETPEQTGQAIIAYSEEAQRGMLPSISDENLRRIMEEDDGIIVVSFVEFERETTGIMEETTY